MRIASVEPTRIRLRSSARLTIGACTRRSTTTNSQPATIATTKQPIVRTDVQPQSLPSLNARITGDSTSAIRTVPTQSMERERLGSRDSETVISVSGMHAAATPASIQNSPCLRAVRIAMRTHIVKRRPSLPRP